MSFSHTLRDVRKKAGMGLCLLGLLVAGRTTAQSYLASAMPWTVPETHPWVDSVFRQMTLDDKIAQLFMVAAYSNRDEQHVRETGRLISTYHIGGLIFFQGGPVRQARQTNYYQSLSKVPLLVAIDGEWGLAMRLDSVVTYPRQMMLGAIQDDRLIFRFGQEVGRQWRRMGIHVNFAPVVDINSNPDNPVINNRAFGDRKTDIARKSLLYMQGMQSMHILTSAKHFPGHGDTQVDSHLGLPTIGHDYAHFDTLEFFPYKYLINRYLSGVMVSHLNVPELDPAPGSIASVSHRIVTDILRDSLHFDGVIYTDALNMKGLSDHYAPGDAEVAALQAGVDVLVMPDNVPLALAKIKEAIRDGRLSEEQIGRACRRVLYAKVWSGAYKQQPVATEHLLEDLNNASARMLARDLVSAGITVLQNRNEVLPLKDLDQQRMAVVLQGVSSPNTFLRTLQRYQETDVYYLPPHATSAQIDRLLQTLSGYDLVISGIHDTNYRPAEAFGITPQQIEFTDRLADSTRLVLAFFGIPYGLSQFRNLHACEAVVLSYQDQVLIQDYTAQLIYGAIPATGKLPVDLPQFRQRSGYSLPGAWRLKFSIPEEVHADPAVLKQIDELVEQSIKQHVMPGCQILAAKDGVVFFNRCYGYLTYDKKQPVTDQTIYDLASVTKIAASVPALMLLTEDGKIGLDDPLSAYLPELAESDKCGMTFVEVLSHFARLQPYINFYFNTLTVPSDPEAPLFHTGRTSTYTLPIGSNVYLHRNISPKAGYYTALPDSLHHTEVADGLYVLDSFRDTIFQAITESPLLTSQVYKYSDMGYYYIWRIIEQITGEPFQTYIRRKVYAPLGASTMCFHPLEMFDKQRIAPTENDVYFRRQVVRGTVNDPGAALLGGVCGHAGLFASAGDLAKLMQLYLNGGAYGGRHYFSPETVHEFNTPHFPEQQNRRGLGFDKPLPEYSDLGPVCEGASLSSFGHSGFTGAYTWADPENGLLYVFLTNRLYPDERENLLAKQSIRTVIHQWIVDAVTPKG